MNLLKLIFGSKKKEEPKKEQLNTNSKKNIPYRVGSYNSYNNDYERLKRTDNNVLEDVIIGTAINSVVDTLFNDNDSSPNYSSCDSDNSSSVFSDGFGGGDYSGGGSSGDWSSSADSSASYDSGSSDSYSSND